MSMPDWNSKSKRTEEEDMKTLVTYFSAQGHTKKVAEEFAKEIDADTFEIVPEEPYSEADIKWTNPISRCNREKIGKKDVPVKGMIENFDEYIHNLTFDAYNISYCTFKKGVEIISHNEVIFNK